MAQKKGLTLRRRTVSPFLGLEVRIVVQPGGASIDCTWEKKNSERILYLGSLEELEFVSSCLKRFLEEAKERAQS